MSFSIFMASRTAKTSPFLTAWPAAAFTAKIFPRMGAATVTLPAAPAALGAALGAAGAAAFGAAFGAAAGAAPVVPSSTVTS